MKVYHIENAEDAKDYEVDKMLHESRLLYKRISDEFGWDDYYKGWLKRNQDKDKAFPLQSSKGEA